MNEENVNELRYPEDLNEALSVLSFLPDEVKIGALHTFFAFICFGAI